MYDTESAGDTQPNTHQHGYCSPFRTNMIVPLIATTIVETPMVSNKVLRNIFQPYGKAYCFTKNILQNSQTKARKLIFRVPEENFGYASFLKDKLEKLGHFVLLSFTNWKETIKNLKKIIIADEVLCRKDAHLEDLAPNNRRAFVLNWMNENSKILLQQLGWNSDNVFFFWRGYVRTLVCSENCSSPSENVYGWCMPFEFWKVYVVFLLQRNCEF
jgi:hypothetical protein